MATGTVSDPNPFRYGGQVGYYTESQAASGALVLCGGRWYQPNEGRWLSRDPIGYRGGANLYEYCGSDPVGHLDPTGTDIIHVPDYADIDGNNCEAVKHAIKELLQVANKRYDDLWLDTNNLYQLYVREPDASLSGVGSWLGHIRRYHRVQQGLRILQKALLDNEKRGDCGPPDPEIHRQLRFAIEREAPKKPISAFPSDFRSPGLRDETWILVIPVAARTLLTRLAAPIARAVTRGRGAKPQAPPSQARRLPKAASAWPAEPHLVAPVGVGVSALRS